MGEGRARRAKWTHNLSYVLRGARLHHARRIFPTGREIMVISLDIQGIACTCMSSPDPRCTGWLTLTRIVDIGRVRYGGLDRPTGMVVFVADESGHQSSDQRNQKTTERYHPGYLRVGCEGV